MIIGKERGSFVEKTFCILKHFIFGFGYKKMGRRSFASWQTEKNNKKNPIFSTHKKLWNGIS